MTRQILYPNYLEESRIGRQLSVLPAHTWDARLKPHEPSGQIQQVKISRQPTLPGAEAETTSRQEDQCTGMKEIAQAVTVNDFYFLKNEITVNILTGLQVALQYSWR